MFGVCKLWIRIMNAGVCILWIRIMNIWCVCVYIVDPDYEYLVCVYCGSGL